MHLPQRPDAHLGIRFYFAVKKYRTFHKIRSQIMSVPTVDTRNFLRYA